MVDAFIDVWFFFSLFSNLIYLLEEAERINEIRGADRAREVESEEGKEEREEKQTHTQEYAREDLGWNRLSYSKLLSN